VASQTPGQVKPQLKQRVIWSCSGYSVLSHTSRSHVRLLETNDGMIISRQNPKKSRKIYLLQCSTDLTWRNRRLNLSFRSGKPSPILLSNGTALLDVLPVLYYIYSPPNIQNVPGGKVSILGGHSIGHSKQKFLYVHVSYSERFPR
jgi:hypothetical protein